MTAIVVVAADEARRAWLQRALAEHTVLATANDAEALRLMGYVDIDAVVRDGDERTAALTEFAGALAQAAPSAAFVTLGPADGGLTTADAQLAADATDADLRTAVDRAVETHRVARELTRLRARAAGVPEPTAPEAAWDGDALARALKDLTRAFAAGFDLPRVLETFLDAIGALVRPSRVALLLEDAGAFTIVAHRGLPLPLVDAARLPSAGGVARWLRFEGRPARAADADDEIGRDLTLLHAVVAVPLLAHGELIGILALGQPVVRAGYGARELETLFDLATHLAVGVRDIRLHHQVAREKEFSERILAHMSSGVVTIGRDHRIGTLNARAEELLQLDARAAVGDDLRVLPSPLGDMLFETLTTGQARPRSEIQLPLGRRWLEVSTYPVRGDETEPLGAVLVFEDLTAQKALAVQRRQTHEVELLASVVARIADEIRNPLVSITTFVELLEERVDDPDFRKEFSAIVRRDARHLSQVFEKLAGLVSPAELHFSLVTVQDVVDDFVASLHVGDEPLDRQVVVDVVRDPDATPARLDPTQFRRALSYLVGYLAHTSPSEPAKVSIAVARAAEADADDAGLRVLVSSRTASVTAEMLHQLFDPVRMVQESLLHVGPAVSQKIVGALGGRLRVRQSRAELAFMISLPLHA